MWRIFLQQNRTIGPIYQRMSKHPSWVSRFTITVTLLFILIPMVIIILAGLLLGFIVFNVLALIATVLRMVGVAPEERAPADPFEQAFSEQFSETGERQNVRVVDVDK